LGDLLIKPENSLLRQSRDASFHPGVVDKGDHRNIRVNGDGFGVAFYGGSDATNGSCVFKFVTPAWSNVNLRNLGKFIKAKLILGHVRAASSGHCVEEHTIVSFENCHPFHHEQWTMCHNGGIASFTKIKRRLISLMDEESFLGISGSTDSEYIFALFLSLLPKSSKKTEKVTTLGVFRATVLLTMRLLLEVCREEEVIEAYSLNLVFTDGINVIATRYRDGTEEAPSLYYLQGSDFDSNTGLFKNTADKDTSELIISSAPLHKSDEVMTQCNVHGPSCGSLSPGSPSSGEVPISSGHHEDFIGHSVVDDALGWALVPNNHMLIARGDPLDVSKVIGVGIEPIVLPDLPPCYREVICKRLQLEVQRIGSLGSLQSTQQYSTPLKQKETDSKHLSVDRSIPRTCEVEIKNPHNSWFSALPLMFLTSMLVLQLQTTYTRPH